MKESAPVAFKYKGAALFVDDIDRARAFYEGLLGLVAETDHGGYVTYGGGLALWASEASGESIFSRRVERAERGTGEMELYFETDDIAGSYALLERAGTAMIHPVQEEPWGQRTFRCYDPDGHIVEVGEPMRAVVERLAAAGVPLENIARRTTLPMELILQIIGYPRFC